LHVDLGSTSHDNYTHPVLFALLPGRKGTTYHDLLTLLKNWCEFWSPKIIKVDFEAAAISAVDEVFPDSAITGCNLHFSQCLWRQIQNIGLTVDCKEDEQPKVFLLVRTLKEETKLLSWQLKSKELEQPGKKRRKTRKTRLNN
jgi:hypothetical protein